MDFPVAVFLGPGLGAPVVLAAILGIIIHSRRARQDKQFGPRWSGQARPGLAIPPDAPPTGEWNTLISGPGGWLGPSIGSVPGRFEVVNGHLGFFSRGASTPTWSYPCHQLGVRTTGVLASLGSSLTLWTPHGEVACTVSEEHINLAMRNTFKTLRERTCRREFAHVLLANGAHQF